MTTDTFTVPHPVDPAALIVAAGAPRPGTLQTCLEGFADQLTATGCFADLTARDTRTVAQVIAWEVVHGDEADGLRARAVAVADGSWAGWDHPRMVSHALSVAGSVLDHW